MAAAVIKPTEKPFERPQALAGPTLVLLVTDQVRLVRARRGHSADKL
jgi:hypothetical protein